MRLPLLAYVGKAYAKADTLDNETLYAHVAEQADIGEADLNARVPIGANASPRSPIKRKIRWYQQTLKRLGIIEHVQGKRGVWRLTEEAKAGLHRPLPGVKLVAFSTDLGLAVWGRTADLFTAGFGELIHLYFSSLPYPLRRQRVYGNPSAEEYPNFVCEALEPIVRHLAPGGSIVLNISNDIFEQGSPARSLYMERTTLALCDRLGLHLMDRIPWVNYAKPPGPTWWACINRQQLSAAWEPILWFTNDPLRCKADNRRVLLPHTKKHQKMIEANGCGRTSNYGDGAYRLREHSFGEQTKGRIPRNVIQRGNACSDTREYCRQAKALDLKTHGAMQPTDLADFFVRYLTEPGDLVVDSFGGTCRTGLAAERNGRRWMLGEWMLEYLRGAAELFKTFPGFVMNPALADVAR